MTIDEMFNELENKARDTFIVTLKYKYDFEENYTIENHILEYDSLDDSYVWLIDWCEGQTDVEVLGYIPLSDVDTITPQIPKGKWKVEFNSKAGYTVCMCEKCKGRFSTSYEMNFCPNCGADMRESEE